MKSVEQVERMSLITEGGEVQSGAERVTGKQNQGFKWPGQGEKGQNHDSF